MDGAIIGKTFHAYRGNKEISVESLCESKIKEGSIDEGIGDGGTSENST